MVYGKCAITLVTFAVGARAQCAPPSTEHAPEGGPCSEGDAVVDGSTCTAQCVAGYTPTASGLRCTGTAFAEWFTCHPDPCDEPTVDEVPDADPAGVCVQAGPFPSGTTCTPRCLQFFEPTETTLRCLAGKWSATVECVRTSCGAPTGVANVLAAGACNEGPIVGDGASCTPRCNQGYFALPGALQCSRTKLTPETFECTPNPCIEPSGIAHASDPCTQAASIGSDDVCETQCDEGYTPSTASLSCHAGIFTPEAFTCEPNACASPTEVSHAHSHGACAEGSTIASGKTCTAQCEDGYVSTFASLTCNAGRFGALPFSCIEKSCQVPEDIEHAAAPTACVEGSSIEGGKTCTTRCADGYKPSVSFLHCTLGRLSVPTFTCGKVSEGAGAGGNTGAGTGLSTESGAGGSTGGSTGAGAGAASTEGDVEVRSKTTLLLIELFGLGFVGADRFFLKNVGLGLAKLLTFGGCGVWFLLDYFVIVINAYRRQHSLKVLGFDAEFKDDTIGTAHTISVLMIVLTCLSTCCLCTPIFLTVCAIGGKGSKRARGGDDVFDDLNPSEDDDDDDE